MTNYFLVQMDKDLEIDNIKYQDGFDLHFSNHPLGIKCITIYDNSIIKYIIILKLKKSLTKIYKELENLYNNDDSDDSAFVLIIDKLTSLKQLLEIKYGKYLSNKEMKAFMGDIDFILNTTLKDNNIRR